MFEGHNLMDISNKRGILDPGKQEPSWPKHI